MVKVLLELIEFGSICFAGWWSSDASHYFHAVTYHLDLVAALQSRGLSVAAAEALLESRPLFCFTAEAISKRDTDVWLQVSDRRPVRCLPAMRAGDLVRLHCDASPANRHMICCQSGPSAERLIMHKGTVHVINCAVP